MNVLLLSSRFPWPAYTGDRLRATIWLEAMRGHANVALIAPPGTVPAGAPPLRFYPANRSLPNGAAGALRILRGQPVSSLLAAPYDWAGAIEHVRRDMGALDRVIVLLARLDPAVRKLLPHGVQILDAIDSLSRNASERASESALPMRWFWRAEAQRLRRLEADAAACYERVVFVSDEDCARGSVAIPNGVVIGPESSAPRTFDFGFWGRFEYFANADAVRWLCDELWPAIRARRPGATLLLAGADAPNSLRALHGSNGIHVQSPVDDMAALVRQVRVALMPLRYGTGQSNKVLEAAEAGCALVATSKALRGLDALAAHSSIADDAEKLVQAAVAINSDDARRAVMATALRRTVMTHYARATTLARMAAVVHDCEAAA